MSTDAKIMMILGCGIVWGGLIALTYFAIHIEKKKKEGSIDEKKRDIN